MSKIKDANKKILQLISFGMINEFFKWAMLFEHFPITKHGKINLILRTANKSIILGIATNHLLSIASRLGIPDTYLKDLLRCKNNVKKYKDHKSYNIELNHKTYLLLSATCSLIVKNKVTQT